MTSVMKQKDLSLPGFDQYTVLVSEYHLRKYYKWDNKQVEWLKQNWIKLDKLDHGMPIYAKPYSDMDPKNDLSNSMENVDDKVKEILLENIRNNCT